MREADLVGRCGLYCGACSIYRAYKDGGEYRKRLADFFECPVDKVRCEGCQVLTSECWGNDCKIVRCLNGKGLRFCYECSQFDEHSCEDFEKLAKGYLEDNVDLRANLEKIKTGQVEAWLEESKERFRCPHCGKPLPTGSRKCYHCGKEFLYMI
ncbi:MAG: DUF3795 domain-containing protein [Candidatus Bathyarchaeia archaeon]